MPPFPFKERPMLPWRLKKCTYITIGRVGTLKLCVHPWPSDVMDRSHVGIWGGGEYGEDEGRPIEERDEGKGVKSGPVCP